MRACFVKLGVDIRSDPAAQVVAQFSARPSRVWRSDDHGLDYPQQELNQFVDCLVVVARGGPVDVGVLQDLANVGRFKI